jgi:hypothetical protein
MDLGMLDLVHAGEAWAAARRPMVVEMGQKRLIALKEWLDGRDISKTGSRRGSAEDHRAAHSAPYRHRLGATGASRVSRAVRGATRLQKARSSQPFETAAARAALCLDRTLTEI